jgi:hypothetical protein
VQPGGTGFQPVTDQGQDAPATWRADAGGGIIEFLILSEKKEKIQSSSVPVSFLVK